MLLQKECRHWLGRKERLACEQVLIVEVRSVAHGSVKRERRHGGGSQRFDSQKVAQEAKKVKDKLGSGLEGGEEE